VRAAVLLLLFMAVGPVTAVDFAYGITVTLTEAEAQKCKAEGGCHFISEEAAIKAIKEAAKRLAGDCMGGA